ncbi:MULTISPECIES: AAA family ATPase [Agrobacterium]|uniref:AAA family ATPase n=1 Tax=Agrobacterium TaxID=357 RepID=UPI0015739803|nr:MULTISPECIES: AAA family ATPase [Agrobacterium]MBO9108226.1 AAA family ATPase [Agrobacterium sp. S2/73]NTA15454.1 AAA family ATPase [Agrobacterium tumefaciens]NTA80385.1 AAA family ATPase [Agrobacterium tumefaciens]QXZ71187.1 AAA family ATPase [Agrobacterium sp. S7/73]WCK71686.1 AAA family ATPase [Agrobacterium tumefaciens]
MRILRIKSLHLENVSRFGNTKIDFKDGLNVICGTNGIGKTTILDAAAAVFVSRSYVNVRKRADAGDLISNVRLTYEVDGIALQHQGRVANKNVTEQSLPFGVQDHSLNVLYIKTARDIFYTKNESIKRDPSRNDTEHQVQASNGINVHEIKDWLANRYLFKHMGDSWPDFRKENLDLAIRTFSRLDSRVSLATVDTTTFDIMVNTPAGLIPYEFLSSGFRAIYAMILGIVKEIEYRRLEIAAEDFAGVILIDEVELHLHPTWQRAVVGVLKDLFKSAQIIVTTHSPHVIQSCNGDEVISLIEGPDGPVVRAASVGPYGFKGWTLEEILEEVMGLEGVVSEEYRKTMRAFDAAIDRDEPKSVREALHILEQMLHPDSSMRKLLRIQAAPYLGGES